MFQPSAIIFRTRFAPARDAAVTPCREPTCCFREVVTDLLRPIRQQFVDRCESAMGKFVSL